MPAPRSRRPYALHCRAGVHARRGGFTAARKGIGKARRSTPQSADADSSPYRGAFRVAVPPKSLPCKGLRSRVPPAAEKARRSRFDGRRAQACFSARRAMRAPQTGRWLRRKAQTEGCIAALRRRYPANPAEPCPVFRRGRCLHRPGNPAAAQTSKRRAKSPALHCGRKRALTRKRQPIARPVGGPM